MTSSNPGRMEWQVKACGVPLEGICDQDIEAGKRHIVVVIGFTILAFGVAMIVLPGPAVVTILIGPAILASGYIWPRRTLATVQERINRMRKGN